MIFITSLGIFIIAVVTQNLYAVGKRVMPFQPLSSLCGSPIYYLNFWFLLVRTSKYHKNTKHFLFTIYQGFE